MVNSCIIAPLVKLRKMFEILAKCINGPDFFLQADQRLVHLGGRCHRLDPRQARKGLGQGSPEGPGRQREIVSPGNGLLNRHFNLWTCEKVMVADWGTL